LNVLVKGEKLLRASTINSALGPYDSPSFIEQYEIVEVPHLTMNAEGTWYNLRVKKVEL